MVRYTHLGDKIFTGDKAYAHWKEAIHSTYWWYTMHIGDDTQNLNPPFRRRWGDGGRESLVQHSRNQHYWWGQGNCKPALYSQTRPLIPPSVNRLTPNTAAFSEVPNRLFLGYILFTIPSFSQYRLFFTRPEVAARYLYWGFNYILEFRTLRAHH